MRNRRDIQELAAEVVRRGHGEELIHLSVPPTASERLQLLAAQLQGTPIVIWPKSWEMLEEWLDYKGIRKPASADWCHRTSEHPA